MIKLNQIKINSANPRLIKDDRFKKLVQSVKEFPKMMELRPIVIDDDGTILGGNMRYRALKELGYKEIPDNWVKKASELTDEEKRRFIIEDNVGFGEWDMDMLANEWDAEELEEWGVEGIEYSVATGDIEEDEIPETPKEAFSKLGDLWTLGRHRLLCGDATKREDVEKLMNGQKADMVFTDPPYNIGYDYWNYLDNKEAGEYKKWCEQWFGILVKYSPVILISIGQWNMKMWFDIEKPLGIIAWIARNKTSGSKISLFSVWEPILVYAKKIKKFKRNKADVVEGLLVRDEEEFVHDVNKAIEYVKNNCDLVEINNKRQTDVGLHKCPKQVRLLKELLLRYSSRHALILDVFGGSGTTLIAAEQLNRTCYMMEIDPMYCDVIVKRYKALGKEDIILERDGRLIQYEEIKELLI